MLIDPYRTPGERRIVPPTFDETLRIGRRLPPGRRPLQRPSRRPTRYAGISKVQQIDPGGNFFATGTTGSLAFASNTTAHNLIVVATNFAGDPPSISDGSNTYHLIITDSGFFNVGLWYAWNIAGGATTITITYAGSSASHNAMAVEYSGVQSSSDPLDQSDVVKLASSASVNVSSNSLTPATTGELWVSYCNTNNQCNAVSPFTQEDSFLPYGGATAQIAYSDWVDAAATATTAPWLLSFSPSSYSILTALFKPSVVTNPFGGCAYEC